MTKYVFSKLASAQAYTAYGETKEGELHRPGKKIIIKGGAGVANKNLQTPYGVVTEVSDEDAAALAENPMFKRHKDRGHVSIRSQYVNDKDVEKIADDMAKDEGSAPLTDDDFKEGEEPKTAKDPAKKKPGPKPKAEG